MENCNTILPFQVKDSRGRVIEFRAYELSDLKGLMDLYNTFEPKGIEAGLPPANDETRRKWIEMMTASFFNIVAVHKGRIIGHAALDALADDGSPEYLIFVKIVSKIVRFQIARSLSATI